MTVHDRAAKTYKTLNDAGRSPDECLREAVKTALEEIAVGAETKAKRAWHRHTSIAFSHFARDIRALSNGGQKND